MARRGSSQVLWIGVALAMLIAASVASTATALAAAPAAAEASSQAPAGAALTIRARSCPGSYVANAHAADCDEEFGFPVRYTADGPTTATAKTDAGGDARFAALPAGNYDVGESDIPFDFFDFIEELVVSCESVAGTDPEVPFVATDRGVRVDLRSGQEVACGFFYVGADLRGFPTATLTIHNRLCPPGFPGPDYDAACHGTAAPAGLEFGVAGPDPATASTDEAGNTTFRLAEGRYRVRGGVPGEFATLAVFCAPAARPGTPYPFTPLRGGPRGPEDETGIELDLVGGGDVVCDWYNTPDAGE